MQTAFQPNAFQNNAFQVVAKKSGWSKHLKREEEEIMVIIQCLFTLGKKGFYAKR